MTNENEIKPTAPAEAPDGGRCAVDALLAVRLSSWEWHHLLNQMEDMMAIVNRDQRNLRILYGKVATQLAGHTVVVAEPEESKPAQPKREEPANPAPLWKRVFG